MYSTQKSGAPKDLPPPDVPDDTFVAAVNGNRFSFSQAKLVLVCGKVIPDYDCVALTTEQSLTTAKPNAIRTILGEEPLVA